MENWVTISLFVLRKKVFLTKRLRDQDSVVTTDNIGHTVDVCYKKHGYPPEYTSQYGKSTQTNNIITQEDNSCEQDQTKHNNGGDFRIT